MSSTARQTQLRLYKHNYDVKIYTTSYNYVYPVISDSSYTSHPHTHPSHLTPSSPLPPPSLRPYSPLPLSPSPLHLRPSHVRIHTHLSATNARTCTNTTHITYFICTQPNNKRTNARDRPEYHCPQAAWRQPGLWSRWTS